MIMSFWSYWVMSKIDNRIIKKVIIQGVNNKVYEVIYGMRYRF